MKTKFKMLMTLFACSILLFVTVHSGWADTRSEWRNGILVYYDSVTFETLDALASRKIFEEFKYPNGLTFNNNNLSSATESTSLFSLASDGDQSASAVYRTVALGQDWDVLYISTGVADNDDAELASGLVWYATSYPTIEVRLRLNGTIATISMNVGFTDDDNEAADKLGFDYSGTTLTTNASNAALFFGDSDGTDPDIFRAASVNGNSDGSTFDTSETMDNDYHIYRIEINGDGDAAFWFDGGHVGTELLAVATGVPLTPHVGLINRTGSSRAMMIDYIRVWGRR